MLTCFTPRELDVAASLRLDCAAYLTNKRRIFYLLVGMRKDAEEVP